MERFLSICHVQFASYLTHVRSYISFVNKNKKQTWKKRNWTILVKAEKI